MVESRCWPNLELHLQRQVRIRVWQILCFLCTHLKDLSVCIIFEFSFFIGDDRSIDHIGTQSLSCRLSGGDSSTSGQGSGTSGATTGQSFIIRFHILYENENLEG